VNLFYLRTKEYNNKNKSEEGCKRGRKEEKHRKNKRVFLGE